MFSLTLLSHLSMCVGFFFLNMPYNLYILYHLYGFDIIYEVNLIGNCVFFYGEHISFAHNWNMRVSIVRQSSNIDNLAFQLIFPSRTSASTDKEKVANMYKNYHVWYQQNVVDVYGKTVKLQRTSFQKMEMGGSRILERCYTCVYTTFTLKPFLWGLSYLAVKNIHWETK